MRDDGAGDQTDAARQQDEHYTRVEKTRRLKIDLQIGDDARENYHDSDEKQQPADD